MTDLAAANAVIGQLYTRVGRNIRQARTNKGITQADLALAVGLTRAAITNIESAKQRTPLHHVLAIAQALDVGLMDLIDGDQPIAPTLPASTGRLESRLRLAAGEISNLLAVLTGEEQPT